MNADVLIIGSGCAGLSVATSLAERGKRVVVLEKSIMLGGRTSSFTDPQTQETVDNGQHMFLGCYKETNGFLQRIGAEKFVEYKNNFETKMMGSDGQSAFLKTYNLPAPFHLLAGYLSYSAFGFLQRLSIMHVVFGFKKYSFEELASMSCRDFLTRCNQSVETQRKFWDLLILATLNVSPQNAPANLLKVVMEKGFLSSRKDSASGLASIGLTELFGTCAEKYIGDQGGAVLKKAPVKKILLKKNKAVGVELVSGEKILATYVVSSVPPDKYCNLVKEIDTLSEQVQKVKTLVPSPIVSLNLWTKQALFQESYIGFWDTDFHWVFNKRAFMLDKNIQHYTLVASGADHLVKISLEELIERAKQTLRPACKDFEVLRAKKHVMPKATWTPPLKDQSGRIEMESLVENFYVAGDWVNTGLPCTIESACLSGHMVADLVMKKNTNA